MKIFVFTFSILLTFTVVYGQHDDGLKGRELNKAGDIGAAVESGIGLLFGASKLQGKIESVTVTDETYKSVSIKISYSGFEGNWIKGSLLSADKSVLRAVSTEKAALTAGGKEVEMTFTKDLKVDSAVHSAYLKILVCKQENDVTGLVSYYILQKKWKTTGITEETAQYDFINESLTITIDPVPVGAASRLKDVTPEKPLPKPSGMHVIQYDNSKYKTGTINRSKMLVSGVAATTTPASRTVMTNTRLAGTVGTSAASAAKPPVASQATSDTVKRFVRVMPQINPAIFKLNQEQLAKGAKGPGNLAITLWDEISCDPGVNFDFSQEYKITNINFDIFPDQNENSGYYYYFPASYALQWDTEDSYQLKILYGSAAAGEEGTINMFMTISPAVSSSEKRMVETLVKEYAQRKGKPFEKLMPLPLKEVPKADISSILSNNYDVPADKITTVATDLFDPIQVSWPISSKKADDLMIALKEIDLRGNLLLKPEGNLSDISIPIKVSLGDDQTFGKIILQENIWRTQPLKNEMPFPVRLKYIHALFLNKEQSGSTTPYIYSWNLNNQDVPVLASVMFNAGMVPKIVDTQAKRIWVEYTVPDCSKCMDKVINDLTSGTISARQQKIEVISYGIIERTKAYVIEVSLRSKYVDPQGLTIQEMPPVKIKADDESYFIGPLFVPAEKTLEYEYRIKMVTDDEELTSEWTFSAEPSLYLTKSLVEKALGKFPEKQNE